MTGGKQGQVGGARWTELGIPEVSPLMVGQDMFEAFAGHAGAHETARGFGEENFGVARGVIRMGVGNHRNLAGTNGMMGVNPELAPGQVDGAAGELEIGVGHLGQVGGSGKRGKGWSLVTSPVTGSGFGGDAEEMLVAPEQQMAGDGHRRGNDAFAHRVLGD